MKSGVLALPASRTHVSDYVMLAKPRLNCLVVLTSLAGYYLGAADGVNFMTLVNTVVGTALVAGGAAALNQLSERDTDALMQRTRIRPLPDGRLQPRDALWFGVVLVGAGVALLAFGANLLAAGVALATFVTYIGIYTPLKRRTPLATFIGAVPGALPPMIGWAAARGTLSLPGWVLFTIVFFWQIPHFLAIAWIYRDEYDRAGIPLLPVVEPDGRSTARQALVYGSLLVPVSLLPTLIGLAGGVYLIAAVLLGGAFLTLIARFARDRRIATARVLFFGSVIYLPVLWAFLIGNRIS
jgi:protoheme IX farnesyltransferase